MWHFGLIVENPMTCVTRCVDQKVKNVVHISFFFPKPDDIGFLLALTASVKEKENVNLLLFYKQQHNQLDS